MTAEKKKQVQLLVLLFVVLIGVGIYEYSSLFPSTPAAAASPAAKVARATQLLPTSSNGTRIRQDLIDDKSNQGAVGRRNVFQYYVPPPPPKPAPPPPPPPRVDPPRQVVQPPPQPPPLPPSALSNFQYDGIIISPKPGLPLRASIDDKTNHYSVSEGDYILGRYRIVRLTETSVEIEDTEQNRRQTYTRITKL
jgi:hypothetical protein